MTVSSTTGRWEFTGDDSTTVFAYDNKILATSDLKVYQNDTLKTETTHYTVSGAGVVTGGNVTFVTPPPLNDEIVIIRDVPKTQGTDYPVAGAFPAVSTEDALDKGIIISQQLQEEVDRALKFNVSELTHSSAEVPAPVSGEVLYWNGTALGNAALADLATSISFTNTFKIFETVGAMVGDGDIAVGDHVRTLGYLSLGDSGGNEYDIVAAATATEDLGRYIDLATHQAKGLFPGGHVTLKQFGVATDDSDGGDQLTRLNACYAFCDGDVSGGLGHMVMSPGDINYAGEFELGKRVKVTGPSRGISSLKPTGTFTAVKTSFGGQEVGGFDINGTNLTGVLLEVGSNTTTGASSDSIALRNLRLRNGSTHGISGVSGDRVSLLNVSISVCVGDAIRIKGKTGDIASVSCNGWVFVGGVNINACDGYGLHSIKGAGSASNNMTGHLSIEGCKAGGMRIDSLGHDLTCYLENNYYASGTTTSTTTSKLVDSGKDFTALGVSIGDLAHDITSGLSAPITSVGTTTVDVDTDIFTSGETYRIVKAKGTDAGTTDGTTASKLVDSGQNFSTTVTAGEYAYNITSGAVAVVTAVDSNTALSLDRDIFTHPQEYSIRTGCPGGKALECTYNSTGVKVHAENIDTAVDIGNFESGHTNSLTTAIQGHDGGFTIGAVTPGSIGAAGKDFTVLGGKNHANASGKTAGKAIMLGGAANGTNCNGGDHLCGGRVGSGTGNYGHHDVNSPITWSMAAETVTGSGAISVHTLVTYLNTTGGGAYTLADGREGQLKIIRFGGDAGDATITPSNLHGGSTIVMNTVEQMSFLFFTNSGWLSMSGVPPDAQAYNPSNVTPNRTFDADTVVIADLADVVGTMIADLKLQGIMK